jgi:hypothetical protein
VKKKGRTLTVQEAASIILAHQFLNKQVNEYPRREAGSKVDSVMQRYQDAANKYPYLKELIMARTDFSKPLSPQQVG